jgi:hypothetical protein
MRNVKVNARFAVLLVAPLVGGVMALAAQDEATAQAGRRPRRVTMQGAGRLPWDDLPGRSLRPEGAPVGEDRRPPIVPGPKAGPSDQDRAVEDGEMDDRIQSAIGLGNRISSSDPYTGFFEDLTVQAKRDPLTGLTEQDQEEMSKEDGTLVDNDAFGPIGPGRRDRLAELAGMDPAMAESLWPYPDPEPFKMGDFKQAMTAVGKTTIGEQLEGTPEQAIFEQLMPADDRKVKADVSKIVLSDAETSFTAYAALGFPLPIRVGRIMEVPVDGVVIFNPQLLRADISSGDWKACRLKYKWMNGKDEVIRGEADIETFVTIPRPVAPVSHIWLVADRDVMAYVPIGVYPPTGLADARRQILEEVIPAASYLRPNMKLYGIRWERIPNAKDVLYHPKVKVKLFGIMRDIGMVDPMGDPGTPNIPEHMKPGEVGKWKVDLMREMSGVGPDTK